MATNQTLTVGGTESASRITVIINGTSLGTFDTMSGGEPAAKSNKHRPGGRGPEVSYAALNVFSDITVSRVYETDRDWELERSLVPLAGSVTASVTEQPLDADGNNYGNPKTWTGAFLGIKPGKTDSTSDSVRMWELDLSCTGMS